MTVSTTLNKITYLGDGTTVTFPFNFPAVAASDLTVTFIEMDGTVHGLSPSAYSVLLNSPVGANPTAMGGSVTYPLTGPPITNGSTITIERILPIVQGTSLSNQGILYPTVVEQALDYLTMINQQFQDSINRAITVAPPETSVNPIPGTPGMRAGTLLGFDNIGQPALYAVATSSLLTQNLIFAADFGVTFDGVTDDTAAWNDAIAFANGRHDTTLVCNNGVSMITHLDPITGNGVFISFLGGPGGAIINHSDNYAITWTGAARGGGLYNVGLQNRGAGTNVTLRLIGGAGQLQFYGVVIQSGIGTLARFGETGLSNCGLTTWHSCITDFGLDPTIPVPLFDVLNGAGFIVRNCTIFCTAAPTVPRNFINAHVVGPAGLGIGSWSTIAIQDSFLQNFWQHISSNLSANSILNDIKINNNYFGNARNCAISITGTGLFNNVDISNNWIDGNGTSQGVIDIRNTFIYGVWIHDNLFGSSAGFGINVGSLTSSNYSTTIVNNRFFDMNKTNIVVAGISVAGDGANLIFKDCYIIGNHIEDNQVVFPGGFLPKFGILVSSSGGLPNFQMIDNNMKGQTTNYTWPATATGIIKGNMGLAATTSGIAGASPFTHTAPSQQETLYITGGTVSSVVQNGVTLFTSTPCTIFLNPGEAVTITYSVAPAINVTTHG